MDDSTFKITAESPHVYGGNHSSIGTVNIHNTDSSGLQQAMLTLTTYQIGDLLVLNQTDGFTVDLQGNILKNGLDTGINTAGYDSNSHTLIFNGLADNEVYEDLLNAVRFDSEDLVLASGDRQVTFQVIDQQGIHSNVADLNVEFTAPLVFNENFLESTALGISNDGSSVENIDQGSNYKIGNSQLEGGGDGFSQDFGNDLFIDFDGINQLQSSETDQTFKLLHNESQTGFNFSETPNQILTLDLLDTTDLSGGDQLTLTKEDILALGNGTKSNVIPTEDPGNYAERIGVYVTSEQDNVNPNDAINLDAGWTRDLANPVTAEGKTYDIWVNDSDGVEAVIAIQQGVEVKITE